MAENNYDSVNNMPATISIKSTLISYMTRNKEIKSSSTNLGVLEKVDLQIKVFQKKLIYKVVVLHLKNFLDNDRNSSLPAICNFTNA